MRIREQEVFTVEENMVLDKLHRRCRNAKGIAALEINGHLRRSSEYGRMLL